MSAVASLRPAGRVRARSTRPTLEPVEFAQASKEVVE